MQRRTVILAAGGGLALVAAVGWWRVMRVPRAAAGPWVMSGSVTADPRLEILRHAILAPNPHNRQPWLMRFAGDDTIIVTCDLERRLPETDPFDRQLTIGFGCFLELARITAAERGIRLEIEPFPDGEPSPRLDHRPIATLRLVAAPGEPRDPLFAAILRRRSTKEPFDEARALPASAVRALEAQTSAAAMVHIVDPERLEPLRALVLRAIRVETEVPRTYLESVRLMRIGAAEIDATPDGIDLSGPMIEGLKVTGLLSRELLADPSSTAFSKGFEQILTTYGSLPGALWVTTPGNSRIDQLAAGAAYVRANLKATRLGLTMHPVSQSLQEYAEMAATLADVQALLGVTGSQRVQMVARVGYGPVVHPSPRWPLETRLVA